ncbi:c-type cytochrome [Rhodanobacter umsongensis]|uniref:C-type cytochrome n=1 Tax=Rhodanobacter umsongensis TaxID=633153 RepID=A0ABW0JRC1_9GAMM
MNMPHSGRSLSLGCALLLGAGMVAANSTDVARTSPGPYASTTRGRYLVRAGDCMSCHTAASGAPFAGGRAVPTPFGTIYSTNITPDRDTGIGAWSEDDFYRAMHEGISRDGHHLYPAFPYPWFTRISRDDVRDIRAYLGTVTAVRQDNKPTRLPWPLSMRAAMAVWNGMYFDEGIYQSDPTKSAQWNRGAYLVQGVGHCSACHGDKNFAGAVDTDHPLNGGFAEHQFAPSLAGGRRDGLGDWSEQDIVGYLARGHNAKASAAGPMAEVVEMSTQYLSEPDRRAIAVYLKSLPAAGEKAVAAADADTMKAGAALYLDNCEGCHLRAGTGEAGAFPPLKNSSAIQAVQPDTLIAVILQGAHVPATRADPTGLAMPAFADRLDDTEVAQLTTYIRNAWGNRASSVAGDAVHDLRKKLSSNPAR